MYQITESVSLSKMYRKQQGKRKVLHCMLIIRLLHAENRNLSLYALTTVQISVQVIFLNIKSKIINVLKNGKLFTLFGIEESLSNYEVKSGNEKKILMFHYINF